MSSSNSEPSDVDSQGSVRAYANELKQDKIKK